MSSGALRRKCKQPREKPTLLDTISKTGCYAEKYIHKPGDGKFLMSYHEVGHFTELNVKKKN